MTQDTPADSAEQSLPPVSQMRHVILEECSDNDEEQQPEQFSADPTPFESDSDEAAKAGIAGSPLGDADEFPPEDDDFGDFDDFDEFEAAEPEPALGSNSRMASVVSIVSDLPVPFASYRDIPEAGDKLREFFNVHQSFVYGSKDHLTPTSQILWEQLMANPQAMLIEWNKSAVHRRLAVALGAPLDLDQSLPKAETRKMALPEKDVTSGLPDSSLVPHWRLLTLVSEQAVQGMSDDELQEHMNTLKAAIESAELLQQEFESVEMSLNGEKEVLEGMVESLVVYAQKTQRTKLQKRN